MKRWVRLNRLPIVGGVNYCRLHCHLAKFRGLIYGGKYSAVIGLNPIAWKIILGTFKKMPFSTNHSAVFPLYIKPRNFTKRQCERQWLTSPTIAALDDTRLQACRRLSYGSAISSAYMDWTLRHLGFRVHGLVFSA
jgi:hypothetical protein